MTLNITTRKMAMDAAKSNHVPQQITKETRKLLDQIVKVTKLSRPKQIEMLVEDYWKIVQDLKQANRKKT
jgi:hypothetical protein